MPKKITPTIYTPKEAATEWILLKAQEKAIEKKFKALREVLEPHLEAQPEKFAEFNGWKFTLIHSERESFSLSKAREKIDGRILAPYISKSEVKSIRPTWQGGDELAESSEAA